MKKRAIRVVSVAARGSTGESVRVDDGSLELEVRDFGPIVEAKVELRPLTVFVGPSNTGKSVLAILCYALHKFFRESDDFPLWFLHGSTYRAHPGSKVLAQDVATVRSWLEGVVAKGPRGETDSEALELPPAAVRLVRSGLLGRWDLRDELDSEIARCFGVGNTADLVRHASRSGCSVTLRHRPARAPRSAPPFEYRFATRESDLMIRIPDELPLRLSGQRWMLAQDIVGVGPADPDQLVTRLTSAVIPRLAGAAARRAWYLPADRSGVMHAHRAVVASLVRRASRAGIAAEEPIPALSGVLGDFLELLVSLGDGNGRPKGTVLAGRLEEALLGGAVRMTRSDSGYPLFSWQPEGWKEALPLARASSMVSELAPVVLWLRHVAGPGDVLIIEEPEAHLHPAMQVAFARELVRLVQSGVRVMVTTHSEWILDAFANLVRLSEAPEAARSDLADAELALPAEQVGAWFFEPRRRPRGSIVREIGLDRDSGTFPSGFGRVSEDLYNQWADITNRIPQP